MSAGQTPAPGAGLLRRLAAGVVGGLAGGAVFGVMMQLTGVIPMVARLVDQESLLVGWAVHLAIAVFIGLTYALGFGPFAATAPLGILLGVFYGVVWWLLGGLTLMPLRLGSGLFVFDSAAWQSLAGHAGYGLVLGVFYLVTVRAGGAPRPVPAAAGPTALLAAPEDPSPEPEHPAYPVRPRPVPGPPGTRMTPLSPYARELRQRGRPPA